MRIESSVTSVSWIPSEAVTGIARVPLEIGFIRYDDPPPEVIASLVALRDSGRFRFANQLRAWVEVEDGRIVDAGYSGRGHICPTKLSLGVARLKVPPMPLPDLQAAPVVGPSSATFRQTTGGRTGAPMPRLVAAPPFVRIIAPVVWTTLELTIHQEGNSEWRVVGASRMPRHWIYDADGRVVAKSGTIEFEKWSAGGGDRETPWGDIDSPVQIIETETALERAISPQIMHAGKTPRIGRYATGTALTTQGSAGEEMFLVLDGMLDVEVDGKAVAEVGPGTILGERARLEGGVRTSTLRAKTPVTVAVVDVESIDPAVLEALARGHHREDL